MNQDTQIGIDAITQRIKEINSLYHTAAIKSGIPDGEVAIWSLLLGSEQEYSQQDLSETLFLSKQTVNSIISKLIRKGFVTLKHCPGSRNRKVVRLTDAGFVFGLDHVMWIFAAEQRAMESVDLQELQASLSMLDKFILKFRKEITEKADLQRCRPADVLSTTGKSMLESVAERGTSL